MKAINKIVAKYNDINLIFRIFIGIVIGVILALTVPQAFWLAIQGNLFVGALKAIAPILVAMLFASIAEYAEWRKIGKPLPAFLRKKDK